MNYSVFTKGMPITTTEQHLAPIVNISRSLNHVAPACIDAYYRYSCSLAYPKCGDKESGTYKEHANIKQSYIE